MKDLIVKCLIVVISVFLCWLASITLNLTKEGLQTNNVSVQLEDSNAGLVYQKLNRF